MSLETEMAWGARLFWLFIFYLGLRFGYNLYKERQEIKLMKEAGNIGSFFMNTDDGYEYKHKLRRA